MNLEQDREVQKLLEGMVRLVTFTKTSDRHEASDMKGTLSVFKEIISFLRCPFPF